MADALAERLKVEAIASAIDGHRGAGTAIAVPEPVGTRRAVLAAGAGDVRFSCVDTLEARHFIDSVAAAFLLPLFDVGVVIAMRRTGDDMAIADAAGRIDYVQPGGATLGDRQVSSDHTRAKLVAAIQRKQDQVARIVNAISDAGHNPALRAKLEQLQSEARDLERNLQALEGLGRLCSPRHHGGCGRYDP